MITLIDVVFMTHEIFEEGLLNQTGSTTSSSNDSLSIAFYQDNPIDLKTCAHFR